MSTKIKVITPLDETTARSLRAGDQVLISGTLITARDAAHKRFISLVADNKQLPIDLYDQIVYFVGPTPARPGKIIGSAGPTTSCRMDAYSPVLMERAGLRGMIGKGERNQSVIDAMVKTGGVYFVATGGAGALLAKSITHSEIICYEDLGAEAVRKLTVVDFPAVVAVDSLGTSLFDR